MRHRAWFVAALLLALATGAAAHQGKEAITRVLFNARTGNIEVMHRFLAHDAEHAVKRIFGAGADVLGSDDTRARFAEYVNARFTLRDQDGNELRLAPVGHELEGKFLWVYAETPIPPDLTALTMTHDALRDLWPDQVNLVNVDRDGDSRSALFAGGTTSLTISAAPRE